MNEFDTEVKWSERLINSDIIGLQSMPTYSLPFFLHKFLIY